MITIENVNGISRLKESRNIIASLKCRPHSRQGKVFDMGFGKRQNDDYEKLHYSET